METPEPIAQVEPLIAELDAMWANDTRPNTFLGEPAYPLRDHPHYGGESPTRHPHWDVLRAMPMQHPNGDGHVPADVRPAISPYAWLYPLSPLLMKINRDRLAVTFSWPIISPGDLTFLRDTLAGRPVVDIGAGTGYLAWQLAQLDIDVLAYDIAPGGNGWAGPTQYHPVQPGGPEKAAEHPERVLLLSWPPYEDPMAAQALAAYQGDTLIYIGQYNGCTADATFFTALRRDWEEVASSPAHLTYYAFSCYLDVYRRKNT